ncbi:MAG TPA: hypothetical protein VHO25_21640, partial [Polyangiaceae bacterium]|nr:hypothetical protein [Polyangiaceae bacterium]
MAQKHEFMVQEAEAKVGEKRLLSAAWIVRVIHERAIFTAVCPERMLEVAGVPDLMDRCEERQA